MQLGCTLRYILQSHSKSEHTKQTRQLFAKFDGVKVITGEIDQQQLMFSNEIAKDLVPFSIGELSVCFIKAPGHSFDNYMIAVTHVTETSTKIPIMFTGDTILVNSVGEISDYTAMHQTLSKLKGFHQETLLFPGHKSQKENILFAKTLEPENPILSGKLEMDNLVPTTLLEERMGNPYFRLNKMSELLKEPDPIKCMRKLRLIQNKFFNQ